MRAVSFQGRHIISIADLSHGDLRHILQQAAELEQQPQPQLLLGRVMASLFFEPSTRTRLSFESAMSRIGGKVIGFSEAGSTSAKKGESLADTIRMIDAYADVIVMRHPKDGAARLASQVGKIPVINGGDGANQHPTQTCLDLYTIHKLFQHRLEDGEPLTVCFAGDLKYGRTVHSLLHALAHFNVHLLCCAPTGLEMPQHYVRLAAEAGVHLQTCATLQDAVRVSDVLYMTRLQEERFPDPVEFEHVKSTYRLTGRMLKKAKPELRILHPLPRVNEIAIDVDQTSHAHYFAQAANGIPIRQALLGLVLGVLP